MQLVTLNKNATMLIIYFFLRKTNCELNLNDIIKLGNEYERNRSRRGLRHKALPADHGHQQAALAGLRQAHDLLPAFDLDARGHPRNPHHLDADGLAEL